jgi:hypothetical protein
MLSSFPEEALPLADEVLKVPQEIEGRRRRSWEAPAPASHCTAGATPSGSAYTQISNNKTTTVSKKKQTLVLTSINRFVANTSCNQNSKINREPHRNS